MTIARRASGLLAFFWALGMGLTTWATRSPDVRDLLGASIAQMGAILAGLSIGSMIGVLGSAPLVARLGTRTTLTIGCASTVISLVVIAVGAGATSGVTVAVGLTFFGLGMGASEVAANIDGADIERITGRPLLPKLHGFFSVGALSGSALGLLAAWLSVPVPVHLLAVAAMVVAAAGFCYRATVAGIGRRSGFADRRRGDGDASLLRDRRLVLIAFVALAMALAEGTANDWLPIVLVDEHGFGDVGGAVMFTVFTAAMAVGRLTSGRIIERWGASTVLAGSAVLAASGIAGVIFGQGTGIVVGAVVLWGLGAALGFPLALSSAGASGPRSAARVSFASTVGYVAFLAGPPMLGLLGEHVGLRNALLAVIAPMLVAFIAVRLAGQRRRHGRTDAGELSEACA